MATTDIIYTIGILLAVLIVLILARSVVIRRSQRLAAAGALPFHTGRHPGVPPDTWNWESPTVQRPEPAVTRHARTTSNDETASIAEQLPRYEAPPPEYDVVVKNPSGGEHVEDAAERVEMRYLEPTEAEGHLYGTEQGEGSTTAATVATSTTDQGDSPPYSVRPPPDSTNNTASAPNNANSTAAESAEPPSAGQRAGRVWGRMFGR